MSYRFALMVAAGTLALGTASAQTVDESGYYGALGVGYAFENGENDFESDGETFPFAFDTELDLSDGPAVYGAIGKYFPRGLRGEFELSFRTRDVTDLPGDGLGFAGFPTGGNSENLALGDNNDLGEFNVFAGMANIYKDFNLDVAGRVTPYVGAGVGFARVRADFNNVGDETGIVRGEFDEDEIDSPLGYRIFARNDDYVTAFQGLAGASVAITDNLSFDLGYRYLQTGEYDFEVYVNNEPSEVTGDYRVHEVTAGLRWDFGAARRPAPTVTRAAEPAPEMKTCFDGTQVAMDQPCPTAEEDSLTPAELRTVVYFDFDSAQLTPAARALLQRRANEADQVDLIEVIVSGNTDTAGSASYNERLSQRRANVVRDALVGYGIEASKIRIRALGESNLAKPTQDGVREPLNRRTEVEFDF